MLNTQLAIARNILPQFESIGFVRGKAKQLTPTVWAWERPDGSVVPKTMADTESGCIMQALRNPEQLKGRQP